MKNFLIGIIVVIALFAGAIWWSKSLQSKDPSVVSHSGLHWHPTLAIYVNGEKQEVSPNIGIGIGRMGSIHTHEPDGTIHLEFQGVVKKDDLRLKKFFEAWGRDMDSFGTSTKMTVNGTENTELGDYIMQDKDNIELLYE
jgi:hypothetical protein